MNPRRTFWLIMIMILTVTSVFVITYTQLFNAVIEEIETGLQGMAKSQAVLFDSFFENKIINNSNESFSQADKEEAMVIIVNAYKKYSDFNLSEEFTIAEIIDEQIVYIVGIEPNIDHIPDPLPLTTDLAEPMRAALSNQSGVMIGIDYEGEKVIAAYEPIFSTEWGLVVKIDYSEVFRPYVKSITITIIFAILFSIVGSIVFIQMTNPMINSLENQSSKLEEVIQVRTKELEDLQDTLIRNKSLAALGKMAGGIGHELRNPLSVISNAIFFLKEVNTGVDEKTDFYLGIIDNEVKTSERIISDLLDFGRITKTNPEKTSFDKIVSESLAKLKIPENIEIIKHIDQNANTVFVDRQQMVQVVINLITNAYQEMSEGGKITISSSKSEEGVYLIITDNGPGISLENQKKIFQPLFTTKPRGVGLGLSLSKKLIEKNSGTLTFKSTPGEGTTFSISLNNSMDKF